MSPREEVERALQRELRRVGSDREESFLEFLGAFLQVFEPKSYDYGATPSFDQALEQVRVSKVFGDRTWIQGVGKPVSKNLSLMHSLDATSFVNLLPAFLLTAMCHSDTLGAIVWQLVPGTTEFYGRIERLTADQHRVVRKWLQLMYDQEEEGLPELHHERLKTYWDLP